MKRKPFSGFGNIFETELDFQIVTAMKGPDKIERQAQAILSQIQKFSSGDFAINPADSDENDKIDQIQAALNELGLKLGKREVELSDRDKRINTLLDILLKYTVMDFSEKFIAGGLGDEIDALGVGLNALGEEKK